MLTTSRYIRCSAIRFAPHGARRVPRAPRLNALRNLIIRAGMLGGIHDGVVLRLNREQEPQRKIGISYTTLVAMGHGLKKGLMLLMEELHRLMDAKLSRSIWYVTDIMIHQLK